MMDETTQRGPWLPEQTVEFLRSSVIPVRLAANTACGFPTVLSLWFVLEESPASNAPFELWCAVHSSSRIAKHLARDGKCAFEVAGEAPPYFGVRGQARAELIAERGEEILTAALERYLGGTDSDLANWLLSRAEDELAIRLTPRAIYTWDYRERMAGAG